MLAIEQMIWLLKSHTMTIDDVKLELGFAVLNLNTANDSEGKATDWMRHWDNDSRTAVSIHKDTVALIQADSSFGTLGVQPPEVREGSQGEYTALRIVAYKPAEVTL